MRRRVVGEPRAASGQGRQQGGAPEAPQHLPPGELHRCIVAGAGTGVEGVYPRTVGRSYTLRTYGCQMNVHDSERMAGLLEAAGYARAEDPATADVVVFNTCAVRENADNKLYGNLGHLRPAQDRATRACRSPSAAAWRRRTARRSCAGRRGWTSCSAPTTSARCRCCWSGPGTTRAAQVEILESLEVFPSTLPARRESAYAGWVSISVGCNNTCTFCIVPSLRGTERDRRPGDVLAEVAGAGRRGRAGGDAARAERQLLRRGVRRPRRLREAAARLRRRAAAWSASGSPRRTRATSPPT